MTAALTNYSHAETGMKRKRPVLSHPIPIFYQHFDLNETSVPLIPHFLLVYQPPLAVFPPLLSQDPMVHHSNLPLFSTFNFLDPLPSATYPLPTSNSWFLQSSIFSMPTQRLPRTAGEKHTTPQIGATTDLCFLISAEFSIPFSNCPESAPAHIPL